jgi:CRP/FNR family transcriptional regulator, anaerobic regulatory protein
MAPPAVAFADHSECMALTTLVQADASKSPGGRERSLRRRQSLSLSEPPFDRVYRLEAGHLSIVGADEAGRELLLRTISAGEWFGDYCLCPGQEWPHPFVEARADEACQLLEIRHDRWLRDLAGSPAAIREFVTRTCIRLAQADRRLIMLARRGADERIGLLLLDQAAVDPQPSTRGFGKVTLTHEEIATAAAMTRPHVSVTLGRFRRKGLIRYRRHESILVDVKRLRTYVDQFDARGRNERS